MNNIFYTVTDKYFNTFTFKKINFLRNSNGYIYKDIRSIHLHLDDKEYEVYNSENNISILKLEELTNNILNQK